MYNIGKIGLGTVQFGTNYGIANKSGQTGKEEVQAIIAVARQNGVQYIDTASAYGTAEKVLGENDLSGFRLISKFMPEDEAGAVTEQLNLSLTKLKLKSLYGYLAHRPVDLAQNRAQWNSLLTLKNEKRVEKIGFSLNRPEELDELLKQNMIPDLVQVPFNLFDNRFARQMIALKENGCEIHTRSTFLQGLFFMNPDELDHFFQPVKLSIRELQAEYGDYLSSALLSHVVNSDLVDTVIIGVENVQQLNANISMLSENVRTVDKTFNVPQKILMPSEWPKTNK